MGGKAKKEEKDEEEEEARCGDPYLQSQHLDGGAAGLRVQGYPKLPRELEAYIVLGPWEL